SDQDTAPVAITLARTLDNKARVVLIELAQGEPFRAAVAADPPAPGIGELVAGTATFGQIITRDRSSRIHVVGPGQAAPDLETTPRSARFVVALEALARSYDHVVIDVGAPSDASAERLAQLAPRAVLIADRLTALGQARLLSSGFAAVNVLPSAPAAPQSNATGTRAAARAERAVTAFKTTMIRTGLETLYFTGAYKMLRPFVAGVGVILTLHHVRPSRPERFQPNRLLEVTPRFLEQVVRYLKHCELDLVSLDEMHRRLTEGDFRRRFVCITIDDGYRDTLNWAYPIMRRHAVPFGLYIPTSF